MIDSDDISDEDYRAPSCSDGGSERSIEASSDEEFEIEPSSKKIKEVETVSPENHRRKAEKAKHTVNLSDPFRFMEVGIDKSDISKY